MVKAFQLWKKSVIYIFKTVNQYAIYVDVVVNKNKQYPCFLRVTVKSETELDWTRRANPDGLTVEAALDGEPNGTWPEGGWGSCGCSEWLRSPGHLVGERTEWREEGRTASLRLRLGSCSSSGALRRSSEASDSEAQRTGFKWTEHPELVGRVTGDCPGVAGKGEGAPRSVWEVSRGQEGWHSQEEEGQSWAQGGRRGSRGDLGRRVSMPQAVLVGVLGAEATLGARQEERMRLLSRGWTREGDQAEGDCLFPS